ncbi:MAG: hypothetical protein FWE21_05295 [Defluviitaleaceae bacterium]|nr:hypothetical protein [Defluviitaleaceae bacterium]
MEKCHAGALAASSFNAFAPIYASQAVRGEAFTVLNNPRLIDFYQRLQDRLVGRGADGR